MKLGIFGSSAERTNLQGWPKILIVLAFCGRQKFPMIHLALFVAVKSRPRASSRCINLKENIRVIKIGTMDIHGAAKNDEFSELLMNILSASPLSHTFL